MNKSAKEKEIVCDSCGYNKDKFFIYKHASGNYYCGYCIILGIKAKEVMKKANPEEVEEMAKALLNTPPRKKSNKDK